MVEVKRKKNESFEALMRRFSKKIQQSGKMLQTKKIRYFTPKPNKNAVKAAAKRRAEITKKRDYLKKIGKLPEENRFNKKR